MHFVRISIVNITLTKLQSPLLLRLSFTIRPFFLIQLLTQSIRFEVVLVLFLLFLALLLIVGVPRFCLHSHLQVVVPTPTPILILVISQLRTTSVAQRSRWARFDSLSMSNLLKKNTDADSSTRHICPNYLLYPCHHISCIFPYTVQKSDCQLDRT